jgi:chemotaxis signal transduction protein
MGVSISIRTVIFVLLTSHLLQMQRSRYVRVAKEILMREQSWREPTSLRYLLFFLGVDQRTGRRETYGINVFQGSRGDAYTAVITAAPDMPPSVEGMVSLRGALVPVIDLAKYSGISADVRP